MTFIDSKLKTHIYTFIYFIICFIFSYIGHDMNITLVLSLFTSALLMLLFMQILNNKLFSSEDIYSNKKSLYIFAIIYFLTILISLLITHIIPTNNLNAKNAIIALICQLVLNSLIFVCYFFKIDLNNFNWDFSLSSLLSVFIIFLVGRPLFFFLSNGTTNLTQIFTAGFYGKAFLFLFYPVVFEEILYRGFLISGLKSLGWSNQKCNIIQSLFFWRYACI